MNMATAYPVIYSKSSQRNMRTILVAIACVSFINSSAQSIRDQGSDTMKYFNGPYIGFNIGIQNVFGGSFVNDMDILAQESKFVAELLAGYRVQFLKNRLVTGLEFSVGFLDGSLEHNDMNEPLYIKYDNTFQYSYGGTIGIPVDKRRRYMVFGYMNETKRKFDVAISQPPYNYTQQDKQGMLKYGIGLEVLVYKSIHIIAKFGKLSVDFGESETNIDVEDKYDFTVGANFQF